MLTYSLFEYATVHDSIQGPKVMIPKFNQVRYKGVQPALNQILGSIPGIYPLFLGTLRFLRRLELPFRNSFSVNFSLYIGKNFISSAIPKSNFGYLRWSSGHDFRLSRLYLNKRGR